MEEKILSQCPDISDKEISYALFIMDKIEKAGGSLKFQHISGNLSQLSFHIRASVGANPSDLMKFLRKYKNLFSVDADGFVTLKMSSDKRENSKNKAQKFEPENETEGRFPTHIRNVMGVVIKVQPHFGFITIKEPVKSTVYFTPANFGDKNKTLLSDFNIVPGKKLCLDAERGVLNLDSKYRATRVWLPKKVENEVLVPNGFEPKPRQTRETGAYDPNMSEGSGKVQNIFATHGFITVEDDPNNIVFFHKKCVSKVENVMDLSKIFSPGDLVEYRAMRSTKKNAKVRWEATKVWIKDPGKRIPQVKPQAKAISGQKNKPTMPKRLSAVLGKIYPRPNGVVIKFGKNDEDLADADSCHFYYHDTLVEDVCWEFTDGDRITFDAIEIKSAPGWKALLGWVGDSRPDIVLPTDIGDFSILDDEEGVLDNKSVVSDTSGFSELSSTLHSIPKKHSPTPSSVSSRGSGSSSKKSHMKHRPDEKRNMESEETGSIYTISSSASTEGGRRNNRRSKSRNSRFNKNWESSNNTNNNNSAWYPSQRSRSRNSRFGRKVHASSENEVLHTYPSKYYHRSRSSASMDKDVDIESDHSYKKYRERLEFYNSNMSSRDNPSRLSSRASSKESLSSNSTDIRSLLKPNPDLYKSWGDTPFPDEQLDKDIDTADKDIGHNDFVKYDTRKSREKLQEENFKEVPSPPKPIFSDRFIEIYNSEDEFNDASEDVSILKTVEKHERELTSKELSEEDDEESHSSLENAQNEDILQASAELCDEGTSVASDKPKPYIRHFSDLDGKIKKVYCKYADVESERLVKTTLFFWNDFYQNGAPVSNQFDDLKEVLKVGHVVKINCFEIVDDDGLYWNKVTMAWRGQKPKTDEVTPHEFISENSLTVSVSEDSIEENSQDSPKSMRHLNEVKEECVPPRKFLAVAFSNIDDDEVDELPSSSEVLSVGRDQFESVSDSEIYLEEDQEIATESLDRGDLSFDETLERMILDAKQSKGDIKVLCRDIKSLFSRTAPIADAPSGSNLEKGVQTLAAENGPSSLNQDEMTTSSTQTIITGEVIAQSIFTQT